MSIVAIEPFTADFESSDDNGKRHRHECEAVGVTADGEFVVIATADDGRMGTFTVKHLWPCGQK